MVYDEPTQAGLGRRRVFLRFLIVGGTAYLIDVGVTYLLLLKVGLPAWLARVPALLLAMCYAWLLNRRFTYRVDRNRTAREAISYALVAGAMAMVNYLIYLVLISAHVLPVIAVTLATACQTIISFHSYRHFVFKTLR